MRTLEWWGMGRDVPSPKGRGGESGLCLLPRKCLDFWSENDFFGAFWHYFEQRSRLLRVGGHVPPVPPPMATPVPYWSPSTKLSVNRPG